MTSHVLTAHALVLQNGRSKGKKQGKLSTLVAQEMRNSEEVRKMADLPYIPRYHLLYKRN